MTAIRVETEPLSWEVLDYWRSKGMPICTIHAAPIVVARKEGKVVGFAALGNKDPRVVVVEPMIVDDLRVGIRIMDMMEAHLRSVGLSGYLMYTDASSKKGFAAQIRRTGVFRELGRSESGAEWFRRDFSSEAVVA